VSPASARAPNVTLVHSIRLRGIEEKRATYINAFANLYIEMIAEVPHG
jgi:hypothetical protein